MLELYNDGKLGLEADRATMEAEVKVNLKTLEQLEWNKIGSLMYCGLSNLISFKQLIINLGVVSKGIR